MRPIEVYLAVYPDLDNRTVPLLATTSAVILHRTIFEQPDVIFADGRGEQLA